MSDEGRRAPTSSLVAYPTASLVARRSSLVAVLFILLSLGAASASCDSTPACLKQLEAAQGDLRTLDARFTQTKTVSLLNEPLVSTGRFRFKRPDKVRLDIEAPHAATVLIDGRKVSLPGVSAADMQGMASTPITAMFTELGALLGGQLNTAPAHFQVEARAADGDGVAVTLTPTLPDWQRLFRTIGLSFAGQPLVIRSLRLDDTLGDRLEIEMRDVQRNVELPDAIFSRP
ncbi:MAG: outer membrane lipoprotein carrier protein LolA [bacterium]